MRDIEREPFPAKRLRRWRIRGPDGASMMRPARRGTEHVIFASHMGNCPRNSSRAGRYAARLLFRSCRLLGPWIIFAGSLFCRVQAMIWYVNSKLNSGTSDDRSLQTAFASLQQALDHAKAGDTILIAPGA
jgi:hypothetical protein